MVAQPLGPSCSICSRVYQLDVPEPLCRIFLLMLAAVVSLSLASFLLLQGSEGITSEGKTVSHLKAGRKRFKRGEVLMLFKNISDNHTTQCIS